jgi:hypothetical protein
MRFLKHFWLEKLMDIALMYLKLAVIPAQSLLPA